MSPQDRRRAIVAATLPLLCERGPSVTTSEIARAAGIAEGTIFRVFADKRELLESALHTAMSADEEVARIGGIPLDLPLEERLAAALAATSDYQDRLWSLLRIIREGGWQPDHARTEGEHHPRNQMARIGDAIARLFGPERASLRQEPRLAARLLLGLAFANRIQEHGAGEAPIPTHQVVDVFLHGVLAPEVNA
jgi:AcrR family transcriptional regulator